MEDCFVQEIRVDLRMHSFSSISGRSKRKARTADLGPSLPNLHVRRGRHQDVDAVERAARVHGEKNSD